LDVTEDKDIIQTITSTIGLQVVNILSFPIHLIIVIFFLIVTYNVQPSLSQLADYDLGLSAFVTSAKRMSDQQASSEFHSDEYTPY